MPVLSLVSMLREMIVASAIAVCLHAANVSGAEIAPDEDDDPMTRLDQADGFRSDSVIVRLSPETYTTRLRDGRPAILRASSLPNRPEADETALQGALASIRTVRLEPALRSLPRDAALASRHRLDRYVRVVLPKTSRGSDALNAMKILRGLEFANLIETAEVEPLGGTAGVPNDADFGKQYGMNNTGQLVQGSMGVPDADVDAPETWSNVTGQPVVIACLDAGIDNHVELAGRILPGWNAIDGIPEWGAVCGSHGTHVAGIAAATGNNLVGIAGMNWNALILPIKVVDSCSGTETSVADGLIFAINADVRLINMSLQYYTGSSILKDAVTAAADAGIVMVAASGNNNAQVAYPAKWNSCIAVAATTNTDKKWSGSNPGPQVDMAAPGADIYSCTGMAGYAYKSGTSFAAPHVSGCASLIMGINPSLTRDQVRTLLMNSLDDVEIPGFDELTGFGRLNASKAIDGAVQSLVLIGDIDVSGVVDGADLGLMLAAWGTDDQAADLNGDGIVGGADLGLLLSTWEQFGD